MTDLGYLDFDLLIERAGGGYRARVLDSPAGPAAADFSLPFSDIELENFLLRVGQTRRGTRRLQSPEMEAARAFGGRLFEAVFSAEVRGCFRSSLDRAGQQGMGLRVRLRMDDVPELADLPWEFLYNPFLNRFLVLSKETPLVRYLDLPERIRPLAVRPPLRVLVMIASPADYPRLDVEGEWQKLEGALKDLQQRGLVVIERLERPTLLALQRRLRRAEYHVFHFVGHGGFDAQADDGVLLLEDEQGRGRAVSGQYLGTLLHDERTLRLAVLNACEGARTSRTDPFAGAAQSLVQQGVPAVIAMQFEITDGAAITLAHEFYAALADGYPVDAALAEARKAIFAEDNDVEWGTPVLYLRAPDGRIFDVGAEAVEIRQSSPRLRPDPGRLRIFGLGLAGLAALVVFAWLAVTWLVPPLERGARATATAGSIAAASSPLPAAAPTVPATAPPAAAAATGPASTPPVSSRSQAIDTLPPGPTVSPRAGLRVFTNTGHTNSLVTVGDTVWAATSGGLVRWDADGSRHLFTTADGLPFNGVQALILAPDGSLWLGGGYAVAQVRPVAGGLGEIHVYQAAGGVDVGQVQALMADADGSIWVAGAYHSNQVLARFGGTGWHPPDLPADSPVLEGLSVNVASLFRSADGALWFGLMADGILRWDGQNWTHYGEEQGVGHTTIGRLIQDGAGTIWAAAGEQGLLRYDSAEDRWQKVPVVRDDAPIAWVSQLGDGSLWATGYQLCGPQRRRRRDLAAGRLTRGRAGRISQRAGAGRPAADLGGYGGRHQHPVWQHLAAASPGRRAGRNRRGPYRDRPRRQAVGDPSMGWAAGHPRPCRRADIGLRGAGRCQRLRRGFPAG